MNLKCELVEKESKNGNNYICIEIYLTDTYKKQVFLDQSEVELLKILANIKKA